MIKKFVFIFLILLICSISLKAEEKYDFAIFFNQGSRDWEDGVVAFEKFLDWKGFTHSRVDGNYINTKSLKDSFNAIFFPGGDADYFNSVINTSGAQNIRTLVLEGGGYIGMCAGADYACDKLEWEGVVYDYPLNFFMGKAIGPIDELAVWPKYSMATLTMNLENQINKFEPDHEDMLYWGGTVFEVPQGLEVGIVGTFAGYNDKPAIINFEYGEGRVLLISPHPEIEEDSGRDGSNTAAELDDNGSDWKFLWSATDWLLGNSITNPTSIISQLDIPDKVTVKNSKHANCIQPKYPFPNHTNYLGNHIKPTNYTQNQQDDIAKQFYDLWKAKYLKNDCGNPTEYYIYFTKKAKTVSEAHGYGMIITALFAGYDNNAIDIFNGLYNYYKANPSINNNNLMDWQQVTCNDLSTEQDASSADGDIDIAFALLLAHVQWGSTGEVDYLSNAKSLIKAIWEDEINHQTYSVKLGDWSNANYPYYYYGTRTSDFIIDHFKVFALIDNNNWNEVIDKCYELITEIQNTYSSETGLLPDFIVNVNGSPKPVAANYLEGENDGFYYYNSCRVPFRITTDFLINNDDRAINAIQKINHWLVISTNGVIENISNGYKLNGDKIYNWNDAAFIGPLTVGAMINVNNQDWLNKLYEDLIINNDIAKNGYYENTLKLLSLLVVSGNYWVPVAEELKYLGKETKEKNKKIERSEF